MTQAYLYRWDEKSTGKWYIGSRTRKNCHPNDGYICSSNIVKPLIKLCPDNWIRTILVIGNPLYIRDLENKYLEKLNAMMDNDSYNQTNGGGKFHTIGYNKPKSESHRNKISVAHKGKPKVGLAAKGHKKSAECNLKNSESNKNRPIVTCPHCGKEGQKQGMMRYHFEYCKFKGII